MEPIREPKLAIKIAKQLSVDWDKEHAIGIYLNSENRLRGAEIISIGTLNDNLLHPREVFRPAVKYAAAGFVLLHNHPSGNTMPSKEDKLITQRIKMASEIMDIKLLDHVIFCKGLRYYSFASCKDWGLTKISKCDIIRERKDGRIIWKTK